MSLRPIGAYAPASCLSTNAEPAVIMGSRLAALPHTQPHLANRQPTHHSCLTRAWYDQSSPSSSRRSKQRISKSSTLANSSTARTSVIEHQVGTRTTWVLPDGERLGVLHHPHMS